ncbi:hypothetical protein ACQFX9_23435 [Aliinostoc sp. HNIBRCY26]|uniref:hypothetical protein n=1 Tax=Aliinostoc sp. HNIBRCY26 TaxID=3418997 RepID=UPI003CFF8095
MNTKPNSSHNLQNKPCSICGSQNFAWGRTVGEAPSQWVYFRADNSMWGEGKAMLARECRDCHNVQLFTPFQ